MNQARARTVSQSPGSRSFYVGLALLMNNGWSHVEATHLSFRKAVLAESYPQLTLAHGLLNGNPQSSDWLMVV